MKNIEILKANHQFIMENWDKFKASEIARLLGVAETAYREYIYSFGLKKQKQRSWTTTEVEFLRANYKTMGDVAIGQHLNRIKKSIRKKRGYLKLKRTKTQVKKIMSANAQKKGIGTGYGVSNCHKIRRELGEVWKNECSPYWQTKTKEGVKALHVHLWEWNFGEVPEGYVVVFKDGDIDNLDMDNLDVMKRGELAIYNSLSNRKANKEAQGMDFMERLTMGYKPHATAKGTVYY